MGRGLEDGFLRCVAVVDLRRLDDLQRHLIVVVLHPEGAAAGFAFVLHHAAHAHRTVELVVQIINFFDARVVFHEVGDVNHQFVFGKGDDFVQLLVGDCTFVEHFEIVESALLKVKEETRQHLFIYDGRLGLRFGHDVVDVLDEDNLLAEVVEVLDECTVSARAEQDLGIGFAEQVAFVVDGHGVRGGFLAREGDVVAHAVFLFIAVFQRVDSSLEMRLVFG